MESCKNCPMEWVPPKVTCREENTLSDQMDLLVRRGSIFFRLSHRTCRMCEFLDSWDWAQVSELHYTKFFKTFAKRILLLGFSRKASHGYYILHNDNIVHFEFWDVLLKLWLEAFTEEEKIYKYVNTVFKQND